MVTYTGEAWEVALVSRTRIVLAAERRSKNKSRVVF